MWRSQTLVKSESQFDSGTGLQPKLSRVEAGRLGGRAKHARNAHYAEAVCAYNLNPAQCTQCKTDLPYKLRKKPFCSRRCYAAHCVKRRICVTCGGAWTPKKSSKHRTRCYSCKPALVVNGPLAEAKTATTLRRRLLKRRDWGCQGCGLTTWLGQPIPLDVEHINGNSTDNDEANLLLLCLNCHGLSPTFKSRNRGRGRVARRRRYHEGKSF